VVCPDQWGLYTPPNAEVSEDTPQQTITVPAKTGDVEIVDFTVPGAPLRLDFNKTFLRHPGQGQGHIVFTTKELGDGAYVCQFSE